MATGRTDDYRVTVLNHRTGARYSAVGSKKECEELGEGQAKVWKGDKPEIVVEKLK